MHKRSRDESSPPAEQAGRCGAGALAPGGRVVKLPLPGAVRASARRADSVSRVVAAVVAAGYTAAIWEYDVGRAELRLRRLYLPALVRRRAGRALDALVARSQPLPVEQWPSFQRVLAAGRPVLEASPRRVWLAALPPWARPTLKVALARVPVRTSALLLLDSDEDEALLLQVAGRSLTPLEFQLLATLAEPAPRRTGGARLERYRSGASQWTGLPSVLEDLAQPLTALVSRFELLREVAREGEPADLANQFTALSASAERLAREAAEAAAFDAASAGLALNARRRGRAAGW